MEGENGPLNNYVLGKKRARERQHSLTQHLEHVKRTRTSETREEFRKAGDKREEENGERERWKRNGKQGGQLGERQDESVIPSALSEG